MALTKVIYAPGSQVQSTNLNNIQDEIIVDGLRIDALEAYVRTEQIPVHASGIAGVVNMSYVNALSRYWNASAAPAEAELPIGTPVGQVLTAWSVDIRDTASTVTARLYKAVAGAAPTAVGAQQTSAGSTSDQRLSHTLASPETIAPLTYYFVQISMPATGMRVYGGEYTHDITVHP